MGLNDESGPQRDLPAAYRSPFLALGEDLRAVLATLKLRGRELWRRNREGDLPLPRFWPQRLGPLFWPLLLALALVTVPALSIGISLLGAPRPATPSPSPPSPSLPSPSQPSPSQPSPSLPLVEAAQSLPTDVPASPDPSPLELDPLLELISQQDPWHLIARMHPLPASSRLELQLTDAFAELPQEQRLQEAERWLERSLELGYEQLVLVDAAGRPLGRQARVGSGMILLNAAVPS
jgi:hypothetical protein